MDTATSLLIGRLAEYLRGLTRRLDPGSGWYGEFLRRDPEGMRACLDGAAIPPWDVLASLLLDAAAVPGEVEYAARLRAAAAAAWDRSPGGARELRDLLVRAAEQRAASEAALERLTERLDGARDAAEADALAAELSWLQDDTARAAARHQDLTTRLSALPVPERPEPPGAGYGGAAAGSASGVRAPRRGEPVDRPSRSSGMPEHGYGDATAEPAAKQAEPPDGARVAGPRAEEPVGDPVGRPEGRWLRGGRRAGGARYAGAPAGEAPPSLPDAAPRAPETSPRGARFAHLVPAGATPEAGPPEPPGADPAASGPAAGSGAAAPARGGAAGPAPEVPRTVARLLGLRAQGRGGEAHALLCEAAGWPAPLLPEFAAELGRAGLGADWATLLWEAASLPPDRLAAAAAALGEAGRDGDCDALLRQGAGRPTAEIAEAALLLGAAGRDREADALLAAFVRLRTAEEAAGLARRDPHWFAPRLLRAASALAGGKHRDLSHALRVAGIPLP
ncbi:hypothetical protein ABZ934_03600 [Streptomyces sp. NPDC046557]|uniref:hypothetical protein n=1 Tax=Streptomyces sp. NPDC046557 TaxID=3155372 RepID=UPI00340FF99A